MPSSPSEVIRTFIPLVGVANAEGIAAWSDDAVLEIPYAPDPWPKRIEGKPTVVEYMSNVHTVITGWHMAIDQLYEATDGEHVFVEMHGEGTIVATGKRYANAYAAIMRVVDGKLQHWREYGNPLPVLEAFDEGSIVREK